jgi:hypothetical protein
MGPLAYVTAGALGMLLLGGAAWAINGVARRRAAPASGDQRSTESSGLVAARWRHSDKDFVALFERHFHPDSGLFPDGVIRWKIYNQFGETIERERAYEKLYRSFRAYFHSDHAAKRDFSASQLDEISKYFAQHFPANGRR